jgi:hypothetical protein
VSEGFFSITKLDESELEVARDIFDEGFAEVFRTLLGKVPGGKSEGTRVKSRFFRPKTVSLGVRDDHNVLQGVIFLQVMGSRGMTGPLSLRTAYDTRIAARALSTAALLQGMKLGCKTIESVTFPQSPTHFNNHFSMGEPLFPAPYIVRDVTRPTRAGRGNAKVEFVALSSLAETQRTATIVEMASITNEFSPGFDLGVDAVHVVERGLGETFVAMLGGRVVGFAICHIDPTSEAFADDELLVKHAYITGLGKDASDIFAALIHHVEQVALERGKRAVGLMASSGRRAMLRLLLDRDYVIEQIHQHWAGQCPKPGERMRSMGNDLASIQPTHFGLSELR